MKVDYGAVAIIPAGQFDATKQYHVNDLVGYHGSSYVVHVQPPVGTLPTNPAYFDLHTEGSSIATSTAPGTVQPDMTTLTVDQDGILSVHQDVLDDISAANAKANDVAAKVGNVPQGNTLQSEVDGLNTSLSDVSALLGFVPSGSTLQGQIDDITGDIGTVPGGSNLQTEIDTLTTNLAATETKAETNRTDIITLNTGLATKIGTYASPQDNMIDIIVHNTDSDEVIAHDVGLNSWFPIWQQVKYYQGTWLTPTVQNLVIDTYALFGWGRLRTLCINFHFTQQTNLTDGIQLFSLLSTAPVSTFYASARNGSSQMTQIALNGDRSIRTWGAMQSVATSMWSVQFTYFVV